MIKRMNKLTALLVAATAVASIAPAGVNAADYKRVESKDGTIYNAVAYNGNFYVDGNVVDEDTDAAYFLSNGKYTELADIDTGSSVSVYGDKYLSVGNGDYYLDLSNGKVVEDDIKEETKDELASTLRKKIRNKADGRYSNHAELLSTKDIVELNTNANSFGTIWYETSYTSKKNKNEELTIYTDAAGNYIDADYNVGKVKVVVDGETVNLTNTNDTEYLKDGSEVGIKVTDAEVIAQDDNYIYRTAKLVVVVDTEKDSPVISVNGQAVDAKKSVEVIQKISKAQASGDIDGAKYAKSVTNYAIGKVENGAVVADPVVLMEDAKYSAFGNKLVAYTVENNKVTVQTINFKTTRGINHVELEDKVENKTATAFDVDVNGNLWRLESGYIYKFDNVDEWVKAYKVDGSMSEMDVYDADNIVVWDEEDEVYSIVGSTVVEDDTTEDDKVEVVAGWVKNSDGTWSYNKADGTKATGWLNLNGTWYYLDNNGIMQTGWLNDNGTWYYLQSSGAMATGWLNLNGTWYYLQPSGAMATGWLNLSGTWYYLQPSGAMATGWLNLSGTWYYLQPSGAMKTGWLNDNGTWYYLNADGSMAVNTTVDGYKLGPNGAWIR